MAHKITEDCIACGVCEPDCPVSAITEGDPIYVIDAAKCVDCVGKVDAAELAKDGTKCEQACPVDACVPI